MSLRVFVIACVLVSWRRQTAGPTHRSGPPSSRADQSETLDEQVAKTLAAKRRRRSHRRRRVVRNATITVGRMVDGKMQRLSAIGSASFFGKRTNNGESCYWCGEFLCSVSVVPSGAGRTVLNGPFAKFTVAAVNVDVGVLKLDYKTEGFLVHPARCTNPS